MKRNAWWTAVAAALVCASAEAQWTTQEFTLHAGWNAVAVQVEPEAGALAKLLEAAGTDNLEGIWRWDKTFSPAEYVFDEGSPLAKDPHWKVWYPSQGLEFLSTLGGLNGGRSYLVKLKDGAPDATVRLKGKARLPRVEWHPNALNLVGFPVGEGGVAFDEWFEADAAVDLSKGYDNGAWQIAADGSERVVSKPGVQRLAAGEAVWVHCDGASDYAGPLGVATDTGTGLDFGANLRKISLTLENLSATRPRTLVLSLRDSEEAPEGEERVAGGVPLYLAEGDGWAEFSEKTVELAPGETWQGTFGVHRAAMEWSDGSSSCQSVLGVRDAEGKIAIDVPVRAVRETGASGSESGSIHEVAAASHGQAGLWIGEATLTAVNCPNYQGEDADTTLPVRFPASLKLIVHVSADGTARLLKEAWVAAATNGSGMAVYASRELVPAGTEDVWRASSATLPAMAPLGVGTNGLSGTLSGKVSLAYNDPVNPFLHRYHPLFDNKNGQFVSYDGPVESRNVVRTFKLKVAKAAGEAAGDGSDGDGSEGDGSETEGDGGGEAADGGLEDASVAVSGTYVERLKGLRAQDIVVRGTFRLEKAVAGAELVLGE